jgi:tetratricopeptide (TPR) repeat protein
MDDGTPPPDSVAIQLACNAMPRTVGLTDRKGGFSVDLNNRLNNAMFADASQPQDGDGGFGSMSGASMGNSRAPVNSSGGMRSGGMLGERDLMGCDLQASLAGFRSDAVHLGTHRSMDNPDVGTIYLHRLANVEGLTISATSAMAPKDAQKALEKGRNDVKKQKLEDAQREFEKAVAVYPKYAAAWFALGQVQEARKDVEGARKSYAQALAADGKFVSPYQQLALLAAREQKWQDVVDETGRLLRLNPLDFPQAWLFNSLANYYLRNMDAAEKSAREGLSRDGAHRYPMMSQLLGAILAQKQDYAGAAQYWRDYLKFAPQATDAEKVKKQLAEVEKITGPEASKQ